MFRIHFTGGGKNQGTNGRPHQIRLYAWLSLGIITLLFVPPNPAYSQTAGQCDRTSENRLDEAIRAHNNDSYRKERKFEEVWYYQGSLSEKMTRQISRDTISSYLGGLGKRKTAALFHWVHEEKLWTWLMTSSGRMVCATPRALTQEDWKTLLARNWAVLGARGARQARAAVPDELGQPDEDQRPQWASLLARLSEILLPPEVVAELKSSNSDTLVVVPITLAIPATYDKPTTLSLSTVPFAALPFENGIVIDKFSIVIAPGFSSFGKPPKAARQQLRDSFVLGNPVRSPYPDLPGAEDEAKHVAVRLGTEVFVRESAKKTVLETYLKQHSASVDLIHLATHGIANAKDPLDKSVLVFSDSSWSARQIGALRLTSKPLVVMSACQTALGKDFQSGTIGLAQAWQRAGASNVVMSLWSVDDTATKELMEHFVDLVASGQAVDKALQTAMISVRHKYQNPSNWASFSIYGAPERIGAVLSPMQ